MKIGSLSINLRRLGVFVVIGLVLVLVMNFNTRLGELRRLTNQEATVQVQATGVMITQQILETQVADATSPAAVDAYARGEAHLAKPGDNVIIALPVPGATPPPTPIPVQTAPVRTAWQVWMNLIFGE